MRKQTWLSMDPGVASFAYTVFRYNTKTGRIKLLRCGMIENPLKNLTANSVYEKKRRGKAATTPAHVDKTQASFPVGVQLFQDEIEYLFDKHRITHVVAERFQSRGRFNSGDQGELISMMLGITFTIAKTRGAQCMTTIAGVWKQAVARLGIDLPSVYDRGKIDHRMEPHPIDSTLIGLWHANRDRSWPIVKLLPRLSLLLAQSKEPSS